MKLNTLASIASPCINWCEINPSNGFCRGCFRTLEEIAIWSSANEVEKLAICHQLPERKAQDIAYQNHGLDQ
ncbi:COG3313 Predicted Fe-S protein [Burkholderiaceae bacterium]